MLASILAAIKAIPELVGLVSKLVDTVRALYEAYNKAQSEKWINEGRELAKKIALAKTDLERAKLVKEISDQWNSQP
jgi:hypothetical protein